MSLLQLKRISVAFGGPPVLNAVDLIIEKGERICLLGRNGSGKSTLMKVIAGEVDADGGEIIRIDGLRTARLSQEVPDHLQGSVYEIIAGGLPALGRLLTRFHQLSQNLEASSPEVLKELERVQHELDVGDGWTVHNRIESVISRLSLPADAAFTRLSGGMKRRVLLGRALVSEPDVLMLDEPTNHLDIEAIEWLEQFLLKYSAALLFITHDRALLRKLATRIIELDRGQLTSWPGDYDKFEELKEQMLASESKANERMDKKIAQEEAWARQGIKARRTRNEGRMRHLQRMREERKQRQAVIGKSTLLAGKQDISGKRVMELEDVTFSYDGKPVIKAFSTSVIRGDRIGIIGPNGCGKTTLLRLMLGELQPQQGRVQIGTGLDIAYFDQHRAELNPERSIRDNVSQGNDFVVVNGSHRHVISYLRDFLFSSERVNTPVGALSGGERNRVLLAKLFTRPSNLLVLDEPTNDLDLETMEMLEELLESYSGTVLLVSHDRSFLDQVVTSTIVFETGGVHEYVGGFQDYLRQRAQPAAAPKPAKDKPAKDKPVESSAKQRTRKLNYNEQRELQALPKQIEQWEQEQTQLLEKMSDPSFFKKQSREVPVVQNRLQEIEQALQTAYVRWEELESLQSGK